MSEAVLPSLLRSLNLTQMVKDYEDVSEQASGKAGPSARIYGGFVKMKWRNVRAAAWSGC